MAISLYVFLFRTDLLEIGSSTSPTKMSARAVADAEKFVDRCQLRPWSTVQLACTALVRVDQRSAPAKPPLVTPVATSPITRHWTKLWSG